MPVYSEQAEPPQGPWHCFLIMAALQEKLTQDLDPLSRLQGEKTFYHRKSERAEMFSNA